MYSLYDPDILRVFSTTKVCPNRNQYRHPTNGPIENLAANRSFRILFAQRPTLIRPIRHLLYSGPWPNCCLNVRGGNSVKMIEIPKPRSFRKETLTGAWLAIHKTIGSEQLTIWWASNWVHGARFQINQNRTRYIFVIVHLVVVNVNSFQLQIWITVIMTIRVNAMFVGDDFPEL